MTTGVGRDMTLNEMRMEIWRLHRRVDGLRAALRDIHDLSGGPMGDRAKEALDLDDAEATPDLISAPDHPISTFTACDCTRNYDDDDICPLHGGPPRAP